MKQENDKSEKREYLSVLLVRFPLQNVDVFFINIISVVKLTKII